jgi:hypothetical protein
MQNRYVADIGDYGKYGLLRSIARTKFKLGINWYLTPDEDHNADGKHITYLDKGQYKDFDDELFSALKTIKDNGIRDVRCIQESGILSDSTVFYNRVLDMSGENDSPVRRRLRQLWHMAALNALKDCDIIFLDPDNGLEIQSVSLTSKQGNKFIGLNELRDYCRLGKSVIFYHHRERKQREDYLNKFRNLKHDAAFTGCQWLCLKFVRGTIRDYIFILQPQHYTSVKRQYETFLNSKWRAVFSELSL